MGVFLNAVEDCMQNSVQHCWSRVGRCRHGLQGSYARGHTRHMRRSTSTHPDQHLLWRKGIKPARKVQAVQPVHNEGAPALLIAHQAESENGPCILRAMLACTACSSLVLEKLLRPQAAVQRNVQLAGGVLLGGGVAGIGGSHLPAGRQWCKRSPPLTGGWCCSTSCWQQPHATC